MQRPSILYDGVCPALVAAGGLGGCWSQPPGAGRDAAASSQLTRLLQQQNYPGWHFIPPEKGVFGVDVQEGNTSRVYRGWCPGVSQSNTLFRNITLQGLQLGYLQRKHPEENRSLINLKIDTRMEVAWIRGWVVDDMPD